MVVSRLITALGSWMVSSTVGGWMFAGFLVWMLPAAVTLSKLMRQLRYRSAAGSPISTEDKVVLVTGASSGIGQYIALEYARRRAKLVLSARREERLKQVARECIAYGAKDAVVCRADVTNQEDCKRMVDFTLSTFGKLDILVNNAGTTHSKLFEEYQSSDEFRNVMAVDFWGNIYTTLYAMPHLHRTQGQIVINCSVAAFTPYPFLTFYTAAKGAILNFYSTLRIESQWQSNRIAITVAFPGFVHTEMTQREPPNHIPKWWPMITPDIAAMAIVEGATQKRRYVVVPGWYAPCVLYRIFAPEILIWMPRIFILKKNHSLFLM